MATLAQTVAGTKLSVSIAAPATEDLAGFTALTYTVVAEVTDMGSLGKTFTKVTHNPVADRKTYKFKGSYDNGALALKLAKAISDAGQKILSDASNEDDNLSFKFTMQDGKTMFFAGQVFSFVTNIGSVDNILGADVSVEINSDIYEGPAVP
jgi:hypothetical protein